MGYSDYGGRGYRGGMHVPDASDAAVTTDLVNVGSEGGLRPAEAADKTKCVSGHVVLGDGPLLIALHKQRTITIHLLEYGAFREIEPIDVARGLPEAHVAEWDGVRSIDVEAMQTGGGPVRLEIGDAVVEWRIEDRNNIVQHVRLTQADGTVWTGFSGYAIGAGHDDEDEDGAATSIVERRHREVFPQ